MSRRILAIIVALVLAGLGTAGVLFYALSADERARAEIGNPTTVAVATNLIPAGTTGAQIRAGNLVRLVAWPSSSVPDDALSGITAEYYEQAVRSDIKEGQILLKANFGTPTTATGGLDLPDGKVAAAFAADAVEQVVAGYVQPGSDVAIVYTYTPTDDKACKKSVVLISPVKVVAVGPAPATNRTDGSTGSTTTRGGNQSQLVIVAVTGEEALRLVVARLTGTLYLFLLKNAGDIKAGASVGCADIRP